MTETSVQTLTGDYTVDPTHTRVGFSVRHAMVTNVKGHFETFSGGAHFDAETPANSSANLEIDVASISTGNSDRDNHLRTNDFFDVALHPKWTFKSTSVEKIDDEHYKMVGDLTIKDVTKPVEINWEIVGTGLDPWGNFRVGFEGKATISRKEWGLTYNMAIESGGVVISDKVKLEFDIAAVRSA